MGCLSAALLLLLLYVGSLGFDSYNFGLMSSSEANRTFANDDSEPVITSSLGGRVEIAATVDDVRDQVTVRSLSQLASTPPHCIALNGANPESQACMFTNACFDLQPQNFQGVFWPLPSITLYRPDLTQQEAEKLSWNLTTRPIANSELSLVRVRVITSVNLSSPLTFLLRPSTVVLYALRGPFNIGHQIGDNYFSIFRLMSMFGVDIDDTLLMRVKNCTEYCFHDDMGVAFCKRTLPNGTKTKSGVDKQCERISSLYHPLFAPKYPLSLSYLSRFASPSIENVSSERVCAKRLLLGSNDLTMHQRAQLQGRGNKSEFNKDFVVPYRDFLLNRLGLDSDFCPSQFRIVLMAKGYGAVHSDGFTYPSLKHLTLDQRFAALVDFAAKFQEKHRYVTSVYRFDPNKPFLDDVKSFQNTGLLIAPGGGGAYMTLFQPKRSTFFYWMEVTPSEGVFFEMMGTFLHSVSWPKEVREGDMQVFEKYLVTLAKQARIVLGHRCRNMSHYVDDQPPESTSSQD